jgi:hypothetical protein
VPASGLPEVLSSHFHRVLTTTIGLRSVFVDGLHALKIRTLDFQA